MQLDALGTKIRESLDLLHRRLSSGPGQGVAAGCLEHRLVPIRERRPSPLGHENFERGDRLLPAGEVEVLGDLGDPEVGVDGR